MGITGQKQIPDSSVPFIVGVSISREFDNKQLEVGQGMDRSRQQSAQHSNEILIASHLSGCAMDHLLFIFFPSSSSWPFRMNIFRLEMEAH